MKRAAVATATLVACFLPMSALALIGGTDALTSKPGVSAGDALKLAPRPRNELIARTVREGSFVSRGICAPGQAHFLSRGAHGAGYWRMDCADAETQLVVMPGERLGQAVVLSCRRAKTLLGIDCAAGNARAGR